MHNFSYLLTYPYVMHDDRRQSSSNSAIFRPLIFARQVLQPSSQHLELSASMHSEQSGDPTDASCHDIYDHAAYQMHRKHDLVSRTLLRIKKNKVVALHQRSDRHISDYGLAADYRFNQTVSETTGEQEQRGANENETPGFGLV